MATQLTAHFPYPGAGDGIVTHAQWMEFFPYFGKTDGVGRWGDHVGNQFEVYADSTGMQVKVKSGVIAIAGSIGWIASETTVPIPGSTPSSGNARIARVIVRSDFSNKKMELDVLAGTEAAVASVAAPTLADSSTQKEVSLSQVYIGAGDATIPSDQVHDERSFARTPGPLGAPGQPGCYVWVPTSAAATSLLANGYYLCDGGQVSSITCPELATFLGTDFGAHPAVNMRRLPDLRGRVLAGLDNMGTGAASRLTGMSALLNSSDYGGQTSTLVAANVPELLVYRGDDATKFYRRQAFDGNGDGVTNIGLLEITAADGNAAQRIQVGSSTPTGVSVMQPTQMGYVLIAGRP